jgi:hypothetical protein
LYDVQWQILVKKLHHMETQLHDLVLQNYILRLFHGNTPHLHAEFGLGWAHVINNCGM